MTVRVLLALIGVFHLSGGTWMLASPIGWYIAVPGVIATGPANHHFISDIGLAFIASGVGLCFGVGRGVRNAAFALAGSAWPMLHALLHIFGWIGHGFPSEMLVTITEVLGVVAIGVLGLVLAWINAKHEGVV